MRVFKIMALYLIAAITFTACTKDSNSESVDYDNNGVNLTTKGGEPSVHFGYYNAAKTLTSGFESGARLSLPFTAADWNSYQTLVGTEFEMPLETVNKITDETIIAVEVGLKDYMNYHMDLKEYTKSKILEISENGSDEAIEFSRDFRNLPEMEQNMIKSANAIAKDFELNARSHDAGSRNWIWVVGGVTSAISGAVVGWNYGMHCCGTAGAIVGGIIGAVAGWFVGSAGKS